MKEKANKCAQWMMHTRIYIYYKYTHSNQRTMKSIFKFQIDFDKLEMKETTS